MAVFFESLLDMLESYGVFTLLAYLLLLILLYYLFKHVLERGVKRLRGPAKRKAFAFVLSMLVTILLYFLLAPYASAAGSHIAALVFVVIVLFVIVAAAARILDVDLIRLLRKSGS